MTAEREPYVDPRNPRRPYAVTLTSPNRVIVETHRFAHPSDAWTFYREHAA